MMRETRVRRIGRATIGSAIVFGASLTLWLSQRPEEKLQQTPETIPWPNVSWVIVTTTSTTTTVPETTATKPKRPTTTVGTTTSVTDTSTTVDVYAPTTTVGADESAPTVSEVSTTTLQS
ncbi:MAG: hypothetical protein KJS66_10230 [Acidobacteria bacterium]|nr:hypothetical protein [Acidobacteriota bacterium]